MVVDHEHAKIAKVFWRRPFGRGLSRSSSTVTERSERKVKFAAFPRLALDRHRAAHQRHETRGDGESETRAAIAPRRGGVGLGERIEDQALLVERNADAGVAHRAANDEPVAVRRN